MCRSLGLDLSGQTSASYNMRLNFERCLLDFENYLGCGQYADDLAAGCAPNFSAVTEPLRHLGHLPPPDTGLDDFEGEAWPGTQVIGQATAPAQNLRPRRAHASAGESEPDGGGAHPVAHPGQEGGNISFLELLSLDDEEGENGNTGAQTLQGVITTGARVTAMGLAAVGQHLMRLWPDSGWLECIVAAFNADTGRRCTPNILREITVYLGCIISLCNPRTHLTQASTCSLINCSLQSDHI